MSVYWPERHRQNEGMTVLRYILSHNSLCTLSLCLRAPVVNAFCGIIFIGTPFFYLMLNHVTPVSAQEVTHQFSLGGGRLTNAPPDSKIPAPGTVTAKYGIVISKDFMPYLATGLAYTYQPDAWNGDITSFKTGIAAELGFNYLLGSNSTLKLDYKYLTVSPDQQRSDSKTPPQVLGIGLDIKF